MKLFKSNTKVLIPFKIPVNNDTEILAAQLRLKSCNCQGFNFSILKVFRCSTHNLERNFALLFWIPSFKHTTKCTLPYELQIFIPIDLVDVGVYMPIGINGGSRYLSYAR